VTALSERIEVAMEKVAGADSPTSVGARVSNTRMDRSERAASPEGNSSVESAVASNAPSILSVAADAEQGKLKSLNTLQDVSESIDDAVEVLNQALTLKNTSAVIRRDEDLNRYLVTIKDKDSGEIVREIPDEALLKFARNLQELRGILFDETT